mgnify:CR=1 FL=1
MTQLANAEKAGYFPLPQSVSNQICTPIATQHNSRHPARCARPIPSMAITRWWKMSRKRQWPLWRMAMVNGRSPRPLCSPTVISKPKPTVRLPMCPRTGKRHLMGSPVKPTSLLSLCHPILHRYHDCCWAVSQDRSDSVDGRNVPRLLSGAANRRRYVACTVQRDVVDGQAKCYSTWL